MAAAGNTGASSMPDGPVVLFDGTCSLCNRSVRFVLEHDPEGVFRFAPLRSEAARRLLASFGRSVSLAPESVFLVEGGRLFDRSDAAFRVARRLRGPWRLGYALILLPRPLRDLVYQLVARNRHRLFGRSEACPVDDPVLRSRLL